MVSLFGSLKSGWSRASDDNIGLIAAGIAYYGFLSLVPLLAGAILSYSLIFDLGTIAAHGATLAQALPGPAGELVASQLRDLAETQTSNQGLGLIIALGAALFGARVAAGALITALDMAFDTRQKRGFVAASLLAIAITVGEVLAMGLVAGVTALVTIVLAGTGGALAIFVIIGVTGFGAAVLAYRIVPHRADVPWRAALRGAAMFAVGWLAVSGGFGFYASNFGDYNATYGSLGAVIGFLVWLWLSAWLLLLGAYIAAATE